MMNLAALGAGNNSRGMLGALKAVSKFKKAVRDMRANISEEERVFMNQVMDKDERFEAKATQLAQDANGGQDKSAMNDKCKAFGRDCIRMCWEIIEKDRYDLEKAITNLAKVEKTQKAQQKAYFEEMVNLRDQLRRQQDVEWNERELTLYFYEPLSYMEEEVQEHVKNVVCEKIKIELLKNKGGQIPSHILEEINNIEKMKLEFKEQMDAKNTVIENLNALLKGSAADMEKKDQMLAAKDKEKMEILKKYEDFDRILSEYEQAADAAKDESKALRKELAQLKKQLSAAPTAESGGADPAEMEHFRQEADRFREEIERLKKDLALSEKQIANQKEEIERQKEFAKSMEGGADEALKAAMRESATARDECTRLQGEMQASQEEIARLRAELRQLQGSKSSSAEEADRAREEIERLKKELEASEKQSALQKQELERQMEQMVQQMQMGGDEALQAAMRDSVAAKSECTRLQGEIQASQKEVERLRAELRQLQEKYDSKREEPPPPEPTIQPCQKCSELQSKIAELEGSNSQSLDEAAREAREAREAKEAREKELEAKRLADMQRLSQVGEGKDLEIARLKEENRSLDEENARLHGQVADLEMKLAQLRDRVREGGGGIAVDKDLVAEIEQALSGKPAWKNIWEKLHQDALERLARLEEKIKNLRLSDMSEWDYRRKIHEAFVEALTLWFKNPNPPYAMPQPPRFRPDRHQADSNAGHAPELHTQLISSPPVANPTYPRRKQLAASPASQSADNFFPGPKPSRERSRSPERIPDGQRPRTGSDGRSPQSPANNPLLLDQCIDLDGPLMTSSNASEGFGAAALPAPSITNKFGGAKKKAPEVIDDASANRGQVVASREGPLSIGPGPIDHHAFLTQDPEENYLSIANEPAQQASKLRNKTEERQWVTEARLPKTQNVPPRTQPHLSEDTDPPRVYESRSRSPSPDLARSPQMPKTQSLPSLPPAESRGRTPGKHHGPATSLMDYPYLRMHSWKKSGSPAPRGDGTKLEAAMGARTITTASKIDAQSDPASQMIARNAGVKGVKTPQPHLQNFDRIPQDFTGLNIQRYDIKSIPSDIMATVSPPFHGASIQGVAADAAVRRHKIKNQGHLR